MSSKHSIAVAIKSGEMTYSHQAVASLPDGTYTLTFSDRIENRTAAQNRAHFGLAVKMIHDHTGEDEEFIHAFTKVKYFFPEIQEVLGMQKSFAELSVDNIKKLGARLTTTKMSKAEFSHFFDFVRSWAAMEHGIVIPDPNPR